MNEDLEYYSVIRSIRSIENADVCILMLDATRGVESQDLNISYTEIFHSFGSGIKLMGFFTVLNSEGN